ncbi:hypothetical protein [Mesorhizobium sp.]|uniref:hypothetical protein n=1 Tax=Mesorhizobium sp. TaxID=1871066 RepID=UPI0025C51811|nr:hypothetical protein [Mesorhizobium sp.]
MAAIKCREINLSFLQFPAGAAQKWKIQICQVSVSYETQRKPKRHFANAKQVGIKAKSCYAPTQYLSAWAGLRYGGKKGSKRMNLTVKIALAGFVASIGFGPVSSFAQDTPCTCTTPYQAAANSIGSIGHANGDVMVSQAAGYGPAKAGNALDFGSRVVVGARGSASVNVGGCNLDVPANSSLDISRIENNICLKVVGSEQTAAAVSSEHTGQIPPGGNQSNQSNTPLYIFGGMAGAAGILAATQDDGDGVSR